MLLRFEATNHRSIMGPVELSMIAVDQDREATRGFDRLDKQVLTVAGIYGPNASGKSNVIDALAWLSQAVRFSLKGWDEAIPRAPFRFGGRADAPSIFEVDLMVEGVRHTYRLEVDDTHVLGEELYAYPLGRPRRLFRRKGLKLDPNRELESLAGTQELLTPTTLVLSAATRLQHNDIAPVGRYMSGVTCLGAMPPTTASRAFTGPLGLGAQSGDLFTTETDSSGDKDRQRDNATRQAALALLRVADLGIDDVLIVEEDILKEEPATLGGRRRHPRRSIQLVHTVNGEDVAFDLWDESAGTRTWFRLISPVLAALDRGATLVVDEIDASLHPRLSAHLLEIFKDPGTNPRGAQLIFTTHDTSLLNHLNRDEVWLTEKGGDGATSLTALAEYGGDKVRRSLNLERAYLQGRFGAVPDPDRMLLREALGLCQTE